MRASPSLRAALLATTASLPATSALKYLNSETEAFAVNSSLLPNISVSLPESYAGLLSNQPSGNSSLFFWFFPTTALDSSAHDSITIWLNGGPGCSSLDGLLQENGPLQWQPGTFTASYNPWSWTNLTNMVWVDQPSGVGYSPGPSTVLYENDVADQFIDFWKHFVDTFNLTGKKIYLTGESYAGMYVPYIADAMIERNRTMNETGYFDVGGAWISDPAINDYHVLMDAPVVPAIHKYSSILNLNETFLATLDRAYETCNYSKLLSDALSFPPSPNNSLPALSDTLPTTCANLWKLAVSGIYRVNPCFNPWHVTDTCPWQWNVLGLSNGIGPNNYFNQTAVKDALHVPESTNFTLCQTPQSIFHGSPESLNGGDRSIWSSQSVLPKIIEATNNVIIAHGTFDFSFFVNGTLASIQNMTWNGMRGFQERPQDEFIVPFKFPPIPLAEGTSNHQTAIYGASGVNGITHTERGLTWVEVWGAGHEIPQYQPAAAYRLLEYLLGRIDVANLTSPGTFTED